jgi:Zn-dependent protease
MIPLGRVRGIPLRANAGWLLIFAVISWSLAGGYFPRALPGSAPVVHWTFGVLAAALLFVCVMLHELSHALVALGHGVRVSSITLHVFGGVSQLESEPPTPRAEFLIAVVGPLTSLALAGAAWLAGRAVDELPWALALTGYLCAVNVMVGVFNLVPAYPLDGGRVLRALLWWWNGRSGWATRMASRAGSGFAMFLMALGVLRTFAGEPVGGLWMSLLGLFLFQAAQSSARLVIVRDRLEPLPVAELMTRSPAVVAAQAPLSAVAERQGAASGAGGFPVERDGRLVGFLSAADLNRRVRRPAGATAADAMVPAGPEHVVTLRDSGWAAFTKISRNRVGRVAVVDGGAIVGVVTRRNLDDVLSVEALRVRQGRPAA